MQLFIGNDVMLTVRPVVQTAVQPNASCKRGFTYTLADSGWNALYGTLHLCTARERTAVYRVGEQERRVVNFADRQLLTEQRRVVIT